MKSYNQHIPERHKHFLLNRPLIYRKANFTFVHAGIDYNLPLNKQKEDDLLWIRSNFYRNSKKQGEWNKDQQTIVYGHSYRSDSPVFEKGRIGIDTGAVYGGKLTAIQLLPEIEIYQV